MSIYQHFIWERGSDHTNIRKFNWLGKIYGLKSVLGAFFEADKRF